MATTTVVEDFDPFGLQEEQQEDKEALFTETKAKNKDEGGEQQEGGPVVPITHSLNSDHSSSPEASVPPAADAVTNSNNKNKNNQARSFDPFGLVVDSSSSAAPQLLPAAKVASAGAEEKKDDDDGHEKIRTKMKTKSVQEKIAKMQREQQFSTVTKTTSTNAAVDATAIATPPPTAQERPDHESGEDDAPNDEDRLSPPGVNRVTRHPQPAQPPAVKDKMTPTTAAAATAEGASVSGTTATGTGTETVRSGQATLLPPKVMVKLSVHEEVSSVAKNDGECEEGSSDVTIEGFVYVQVQCSDAKKNAPFMIRPILNNSDNDAEQQALADGDGGDSDLKKKFTIRPDNGCSRNSSSIHNNATNYNNSNNKAYSKSLNNDGILVTLPKKEIGFVPVAQYTYSGTVKHMPLLLERKVTFNDTNRTCRIAVQVRSKLTNKGDLEDFTVAVSIPEHIDGDTITIIRGDNGVYDELKRLIKWKLPSLNKGESFMVCAQGKFWRKRYEGYDDVRFPVLLRTSAPADRISIENGLDFIAQAIDGYPASVTTATKTNTFRLLHRLS